MQITNIVKRTLAFRATSALRDYTLNAERVQRHELSWLLSRGSDTQYLSKCRIKGNVSYEKFKLNVPVVEYNDLEPYIQQMMQGEANVLWHGVTKNFAQSSGTSGNRSKFIPITDESLQLNHYSGASSAVAHYLNITPDSKMFDGKALILGGSFNSNIDVPKGVRVGDLSATLIDKMGFLPNMFRVPNKEIALMEDWAEKLPAIVEASMNSNVTNISGVPSWFLSVLKEVMAKKGVSNIHEVWPNLEVFFHGGISFEPYRAQYEAICDKSKMHFLETYNASEGFFAVQSSWKSKAMLLLINSGVFFEFIPLGGTAKDAVPIWGVNEGMTYSLLITAPNGLWRYAIGDTVKIESVQPLKISIVGRTQAYINTFGEELMVHNADSAIAAAQRETGLNVLNYTAAPLFPTLESKGRHQWLIEFTETPSTEALDAFTKALDNGLQVANSDYAAKRAGNLFIDQPEVIVARTSLFDEWLLKTGKLGGQRKVPRLSPERTIIESMLNM